MTAIQEEFIAETTVRFPAPAPTGHWDATVVVRRQTHETGEQYYHIDYDWLAVFDDAEVTDKTWEALVEFEKQQDLELVLSDTMSESGAIASMKDAHPFYSRGRTLDDGHEGEIIARNEMTDSLVKHLVMDDDELSKHSGGVTAVHYRKILMRKVLVRL